MFVNSLFPFFPQVLTQVVLGSGGQLTPRGSMAWHDFAATLQEEGEHTDNVSNTSSSNSNQATGTSGLIPSSDHTPRSPVVDPVRDFTSTSSIPSSRSSMPPSSPRHTNTDESGNDSLKLAARTVWKSSFSLLNSLDQISIAIQNSKSVWSSFSLFGIRVF